MQQEVDILVNGKPVRQIAHEGKLFIAAKEGSQYEIRLRNHSIDRVTGVVSVDGVNVVDGERATEKGGGYIINGLGSYLVKGFRTSNDEVHPFIFNRKEKSYAAKSENGDVQDCGVIGVIFWNEKPAPQVIEHIHHDHYYPNLPSYPIYPWERKYPYDITFTCGLSGIGDSAQYMCSQGNGLTGQNMSMLRSSNLAQSVQSDTPPFDLGTEFAKHSVEDKVQTVDFDWGRAKEPILIYYASKEVLRAMGVPVERESKVVLPQAFHGFCKPPRD